MSNRKIPLATGRWAIGVAKVSHGKLQGEFVKSGYSALYAIVGCDSFYAFMDREAMAPGENRPCYG
jgi:hypothetical protein